MSTNLCSFTRFEVWSGLRVEGASQFQKIEDIPYQISAHIRAGSIIPILVS